MGGRYLIVNADDFGQSAGVNRGIIESHKHGIVTSASLMVRWPAAPEAAEYGRNATGFSLGLHFDFGEWTYRQGSWAPLYEVVALNDVDALAEEMRRQLAAFQSLTGKNPTHLDSHQHVHRNEPLRSLVTQVGQDLEVPVRHDCRRVCSVGRFYGQTAGGSPLPESITREALIAILSSLSPGITELVCHPGEAHELNSTYRAEREIETKVLCDPPVRLALAALGIQLCSFANILNL